jgi:hypothetical protein
VKDRSIFAEAAKNTSKEQRIAIAAVRFCPENRSEAEIQFRRDEGERRKGERVSAVRSCAEDRQPLDQ